MSTVPWFNRFWWIFACCLSSLQASPATDRFAPSGVNSQFSYQGQQFDEYAAIMRTILVHGLWRPKGLARELALQGNAPYERIPAADCARDEQGRVQRGILLLHGLSDSPFSLRYLADFFHQHCFHVQVLLLPGHGTRPGDLRQVEFTAWQAAVVFGMQNLQLQARESYLVGYSLGATLAVEYAMEHPVQGVFLFAPALGISPWAGLSCGMAALGEWWPALRWIQGRQTDDNLYKYETFASNAVCQIHRLLQRIQRLQRYRQWNTPVFIAASEDDATVDVNASFAFFANARVQPRQMLVYSRNTENIPPADTAIKRISSVVPEQGIHSFSHTSLLFPAGDPYYGIAGSYAFCTQYYPEDAASHARCLAREEDILGEISDEFLEQGVVRRLTYNPHFTGLLQEMERFIEALPVLE